MMIHATYRALIGVFFFGLCLPFTLEAAADHQLVSKLKDAEVTVSIPSDNITVGDSLTFNVDVKALKGPAPAVVRARLGMPDHGHWVTDAAEHVYQEGALTFDTAYPMQGKYRFRIWLDYADGRQQKTAVDFIVKPAVALNPQIVP